MTTILTILCLLIAIAIIVMLWFAKVMTKETYSESEMIDFANFQTNNEVTLYEFKEWKESVWNKRK